MSLLTYTTLHISIWSIIFQHSPSIHLSICASGHPMTHSQNDHSRCAASSECWNLFDPAELGCCYCLPSVLCITLRRCCISTVLLHVMILLIFPLCSWQSQDMSHFTISILRGALLYSFDNIHIITIWCPFVTRSWTLRFLFLDISASY